MWSYPLYPGLELEEAREEEMGKVVPFPARIVGLTAEGAISNNKIDVRILGIPMKETEMDLRVGYIQVQAYVTWRGDTT